MVTAHPLNEIYAHMKFHLDMLNTFGDMLQTNFRDKQTDSQICIGGGHKSGQSPLNTSLIHFSEIVNGKFSKHYNQIQKFGKIDNFRGNNSNIGCLIETKFCTMIDLSEKTTFVLTVITYLLSFSQK